MQIVINLGEKYSDEGYLDEIITDTVRNEIVSAILGKIRARVETELNKLIGESVEKQLSQVIQDELAKRVDAGVIKVCGRDITIAEHVRQTFMEERDWRNFSRTISELAEKHCKTLKAQYDLAFATQIVNNLNQAGMLKDDVGNLLLAPIKAD